MHLPVTAEARQVYDRLWTEAVAGFQRDEVQIDPYLQRPETDQRQGITLIVRPEAAVAEEFSGLIETLRQQEPEQYYYRPGDYHVTVMTLISAAAGFDLAQTPVATYQALFNNLFRRFSCFAIRFQGISASPAAVLAQGFVDNDSLNQIRVALRRELQAAGLAKTLDVRYRIVTAHVTLMRYRSPLRNTNRLLALLEEARRRYFGTSRVEQIDFVLNDWYMAENKVRVLDRYALKAEMIEKLDHPEARDQ